MSLMSLKGQLQIETWADRRQVLLQTVGAGTLVMGRAVMRVEWRSTGVLACVSMVLEEDEGKSPLWFAPQPLVVAQLLGAAGLLVSVVLLVLVQLLVATQLLDSAQLLDLVELPVFAELPSLLRRCRECMFGDSFR